MPAAAPCRSGTPTPAGRVRHGGSIGAASTRCWRITRQRAGAELRQRTRLVGLVTDDGRVRGAKLRDAVTRRDEVVSAGWTIGADGTRSSVSRLVGADRAVRFPRRIGLVAHYSGIGDLTDHGEMHVGPGYYVGLAPTPGGELNVGMALPMDRRRGSARASLRGGHRRPAVGRSPPRRQRAPHADSRCRADRSPRVDTRRARLAAGRRCGRLRGSVHRRGHPPCPPLSASRRRRDPGRR